MSEATQQVSCASRTTILLSIIVSSLSVCVAQDSRLQSCGVDFQNSRAEWTTFHHRRGLFLSTSPKLFTKDCDNSLFDTAHASTFFQHDTMLHNIEARTDIFLQISTQNLDLAALRFAIAGVVLNVNRTHTRTHTHRRLSGPHTRFDYNQVQEYSHTEMSLKPQQLQELRITIVKNDSECALSLQIGALLPLVPVARQRWQCDATNHFHLHGNHISLHSVVLQINNQRQAMWDFSQEYAPNNTLCGGCPSGKTMNVDLQECTDCYTGFRVNVDHSSPWWSNPIPTQLSTVVVPEPDWAVLKVHGNLQSKGIMRHSSMANNGNMILTPYATEYGYEQKDTLPNVCADLFQSRVRRNLLGTDQCTLGLLFNAGVSRILISWWPPSSAVTVRAYLSVEGMSWSLADTVTFCDHDSSALEVQHTCVNPIVFTYVRFGTWHPLNIHPIHHKYTRYTLSLKYEMYFQTPYK
jgi:hypothetical protein